MNKSTTQMYRIESLVSGAILGTYAGETLQHALLACYRDAGYGEDAARINAEGLLVLTAPELDPSELLVTVVAEG